MTLLALGTGHRLQASAVVSLTNIKKSKTRLEMKIKDLIKTSKKGLKQSLLQLPIFKENPQLCIVTHMLRYIEVSKELRKDYKKLLITWKKLHKEASSETISR